MRGMGGSRHGERCWDALLHRSPAKSIAMLAHSAGGAVSYQLLSNRPDCLDRTRFLALTDAVEGVHRSSPK